MRKATLLFLMLLLAAPALSQDGRRETILGLGTDFAAGRIAFEVAGTGCTAKQDFRVAVSGDTLTLFRLRPDSCKAMPQKVTIAFTLEELGLSPHRPFTLGNPIIVNENLTGL